MLALKFIFICGLFLMAVAPFIPSVFVFLVGAALVLTIMTISAMAILERHLS